jgi:dihydrofolate reductase
MRKLILKMSMSLDGFVGGTGGELAWVFHSVDEAATAWTLATVWNASLHIMGSRTFHDMSSYWPTSTGEFAPPMNQIPKAVFSKRGPAMLKNVSTTAALDDAARANVDAGQSTKPQPGAESWAQAHVVSGDLAEEISKLKAQDGKPIIAHGGGAFARSLVACDLIDEYALLVHPVALGKGMALFSDLAAPRTLKLVSATVFGGGAVAQIYRPVPAQ